MNTVSMESQAHLYIGGYWVCQGCSLKSKYPYSIPGVLNHFNWGPPSENDSLKVSDIKQEVT